MPNSRKRRKFGCRPGSLSLDRTDAKSVLFAPTCLVRQNEVHQEQDQQQRADDQPDAAQILEHVRILGTVGRKRQRGWAHTTPCCGWRRFSLNVPRPFGRRLDCLSRLFAIGELELIWLDLSFGRGKPVPTFRRWP